MKSINRKAPWVVLFTAIVPLSASTIVLPTYDSLTMSSDITIDDPIDGVFTNHVSVPPNSSAPNSLPVNLGGYQNQPIVFTDTGAPVLAFIKDSATVFAGAIDSSGQLHGAAIASAESDGPANTLGPIFNTGAEARFNALWIDTLLIVSSTLPQGTPVDLELTNSTFSVVSAGAAGPGTPQDANVLSLMVLSGTRSGDPAGTQAQIFNDSLNPVNNLQIVKRDITGYVGETLQLSEELVLVATASSSFLNTGVHSSTADASDTAAAFVDVLTPGATYVTASGINYSSPVATPEPATSLFVLMGIGCIVLRKQFRFILRRCSGQPDDNHSKEEGPGVLCAQAGTRNAASC